MDIKEVKFLLTHSSIYGLGTIVSQAVAFIMLPVYTRFLTPEDYGTIELIDITNMLIGLIVTMGIARGMSRFYYENDTDGYKDKVVSSSYIVYVGICVLVFPFLFMLTPFFSKLILSNPIYYKYFMISFASLFLGGIVDIGLMCLRLEKRPIHFVSITVSRLFVLICLNIIFVAFLKMGVMGILLSTLLSRIVFSVYVTFSILKNIKFGFSVELSKEILKFCMPLVPANFANAMIKQSDKYFILYFFTIADAGIYSLALKFGNALHLILTMPFMMTYIPRRFEIMKKEGADQIFKQVYTYYSFIYIILGLSISILIPEILRIMTTEDFYRAGQYVPLVVLSMFLYGSEFHFEFGILHSKKTKYLAYINTIIAILHIGLNYILIREFGMWGAIWASVIVLGSQALIKYMVSNRFFKILFEFGRILKYMILAIFCFTISQFIHTNHVPLDILVKVILLACFLFVAVFGKIISEDDLNTVKLIVKRNFPIRKIPA